MPQKSALILCATNPKSDPRPNRMVEWLRDNFHVMVLVGKAISIQDSSIENLNSDEQATPKKRKNKLLLLKKLIRLSLLIFRRFDEIIKLDIGSSIQNLELVNIDIDLVISHDIVLLPLACEIAKVKKAKTLFDAREYYPQEFENDFLWRSLIQPFNKHLCETYLHQCDKVITVSDGIAREYKAEYGIEVEVIMSLPDFHEIEPILSQNNSIRMIYHGQASPDRQIEKMIEIMDYLGEHISLDLMLVPPARPHRAYWRKIAAMAKKRARVRIIPPVPMKKIIEFTSRYDIGLFICPPTTFNLKYALPNKFFEYIQARLAVAIGPSIEMRKVVEKYHCGIVSNDFTPRSLADELSEIGHDELLSYKKQSNNAALDLNATKNSIKIHRIVKDLLV